MFHARIQISDYVDLDDLSVLWIDVWLKVSDTKSLS